MNIDVYHLLSSKAFIMPWIVRMSSAEAGRPVVLSQWRPTSSASGRYSLKLWLPGVPLGAGGWIGSLCMMLAVVVSDVVGAVWFGRRASFAPNTTPKMNAKEIPRVKADRSWSLEYFRGLRFLWSSDCWDIFMMLFLLPNVKAHRIPD
jgi:hypothetical protein